MSAAIFIKRIISWEKNCFGQKHHGACRARKSSIDAEWWGYDLPLTACADECCRSSSGCTADAKSWDGGDLGDPFFKTTYHKRYNDPSDGWTFQRQHQTASPGASRAWKRPSWSALAQKHLWCMTSGRPLHRLWLTLGSNPRRLWTIARDGETVQRAFTPMTLKVNSPDWKGMWESVMAVYPSNAKGLTTQRKRMPWMPEISMSIHSKRM